MNLHLLIPALFWPSPALPEIYRDLRLPALENILAKSSCIRAEAQEIDAWLCHTFSVAKQLDWPVAPITLQADAADHMEAENGYWIRADPVHLRIERDQVVLADSRVFPISSQEAAELADVLNKHFAGNEQDMVFFPLRPDRWYLRLTNISPAHTHTLNEVANRAINELLPFGADNATWRSFFNEVQMLLHEHSLNQSREVRAEPPINAVWFWGGGIMPTSVVSPYTHVWSDDAFASSLALASDTNQAPLPPGAAVWRQSASSGNHLVVLNGLHGKAQYRDAYSWRESLKELEQNWFDPLRAMLGRGEFHQVTLTTLDENGSRSFTASRGDLKKFWRRPKAISTYASG